MSTADLFVLPYTFAASALSAEGQVSIADWLYVWVLGSWAAVAAMLSAGFVVYCLCDWFGTLSYRLYRTADRGARLNQRRRLARWYVRVTHVLHSIKRPTGFRRMPRGRPPGRERITSARRSGTLVRLLLLLCDSAMSLAGRTIRLVCSWFGLYSIIGATWATHRQSLQEAGSDVLRLARRLDVPVGMLALAFAAATFLLANAVSWRRRGLSKWRADHTVEGFQLLNTIRVGLARMRDEIGPALVEWHAAMARSWSSATSPGGTQLATVSTHRRGPWRDGFDAVHESWEAELVELEKIISDGHQIAGVMAATPLAARPVISDPRLFLGIDAFSPVTRQVIDDLLNAAADRRRQYRHTLDMALEVALDEVDEDITGELHQRLEIVCEQVLNEPSPSASERYTEVADAAADDAARCFLPALERHLRCVEVAKLIDFEDKRAVSQCYHDAVEQLVCRLALSLKVVLREHLNARSLHTVQLQHESSAQFWASLGQPPHLGDGRHKVITDVIAAAVRAVRAQSSAAIHLQLDPVLDGCLDEHRYTNFIDERSRNCCEAEAELLSCLASLDRFLIPRSRWAQMRAALSR